MRCKPLLIFHGDPIGDSRRQKEEKRFDKRVCTAFNQTAWADSTNLKDWVKNQYSCASEYLAQDNEPRLLTLNAFAPQMTEEVTAEFAKLNCTTSYIPSGCTGFVQVLDVSLNKPLKALVAQAAEDHADKYASQYEEGAFTVADRRVLLTEWVGTAWTQLHTEYKQTIINTFRHVGLSLCPDGSEDHEIKIKGLDNIAIRDYARGKVDEAGGLGSLTPIDIAAIAAAKVRLAAKEQPDLEDEDEHEEVQTLSRMSTQSYKQINRFFTAAEVAEEVAEVREEIEQGMEEMEEDIEGDNGEPNFDTSDEEDIEFDDAVDGDVDEDDENM
jgi:hypothetical protein